MWQRYGSNRNRDGYLITGLETMPEARRKGYATKLLKSAVQLLGDKKSVKVYAHVDKGNIASLTVHDRCGFQRILENAVYLDGSAFTTSCTLLFHNGN